MRDLRAEPVARLTALGARRANSNFDVGQASELVCIAVFSDEPYCHMVWDGRHESIGALPGMLEQCSQAYGCTVLGTGPVTELAPANA